MGMISASVVVVAAALGSPGLGLLGVAGFLWAGAAAACSRAPLIAGRPSSLNEHVSTLLSTAAAATALLGALGLAISLLA